MVSIKNANYNMLEIKFAKSESVKNTEAAVSIVSTVGLVDQWRRQLWGTEARPPDFQQFHF